MENEAPRNSIIVFDGVCVLCSRWVTFLIKRDPDRQFHFAAMQTERGREILGQAGLDPDDPSSFVLLHEGKVFRETDAIIVILKALSGVWSLAASLISIFPKPVRNWMYFRIARNRYAIFGRRDVCYVPAAEDKDRFAL